jgi:hypothetical protein
MGEEGSGKQISLANQVLVLEISLSSSNIEHWSPLDDIGHSEAWVTLNAQQLTS